MPVIMKPWLVVETLKNEEAVKLAQFIKVTWLGLLVFRFPLKLHRGCVELSESWRGGSIHSCKMVFKLLRNENGENRDSLRL